MDIERTAALWRMRSRSSTDEATCTLIVRNPRTFEVHVRHRTGVPWERACFIDEAAAAGHALRIARLLRDLGWIELDVDSSVSA